MYKRQVQEAAVQAGPKRDLWYWNSILKTWNAKGLRNIHDVRTPVAAAGASRNIRVAVSYTHLDVYKRQPL